MAKKKAQMEQLYQGGFRLSRLVELKSVRFLNITAGTSFPTEKPSGRTRQLHALINWEVSSVPTEMTDCLLVHVVGHFGVAEDIRKEPLKADAEVHLTLELAYRLPADAGATDEEKQEFAKTNGLFNAWPFLRAELFGLLPRFGLPPYVLPVRRVSPPPAGHSSSDREGGFDREPAEEGA